VQSTAVTVQRKLKIRKRKRKEICLQFSVVDNVTSGGREFHLRDAAAGKAQSPVVRRCIKGTATANDDVRDTSVSQQRHYSASRPKSL